MRHTQNEQHEHDHSNGACSCPSCSQERNGDDQDLIYVSHEHHNHSHGHDDRDHDAPASNTASLTTGELTGGNTTGKPNFNWAQGAAQISRDNRKWDGGALGTDGTVTYSYLSNSQASSGYGQVSSAQRAALEKAMAQWSMIANIDFVAAGGGSNVSGNGELKFQGAPGNGGGWASWSARSSGEMVNATVAVNGSGLSLALHEVGHAIGLSHPGPYNGGGFNYNDDAVFYQDSDQYTVMSYWGGGNTGALLRPATGPALYDIAAIQRVYGANIDAYTGNTTYGFNSNTGDSGWTLSGQSDWIQAAIWDAGGIDTIDMSGYSRSADIDLRQEAFSSTGDQRYNLSIAKDVVIENAVGGSGNDTLRGNSSANDLDGGRGNDTMRGAGGNDRYHVDSAADQVIEAAGQGIDFIFTTVSYQIAANVERIIAEASTALNLTARNNQSDILIGNAETNVFVDQFGRDIYVGGGGSDFFRFIANLDDVNNLNRINDFNPVDDQIQLENAVFTGLAVGGLSASQFRTGTSALDANDRIIYDSSTGFIYHDRDGSGGSEKIAFAAVAIGTALTEDDFQII